MSKRLEKRLLYVLVFVLILSFHLPVYGQKEEIVTPSGLTKSQLNNSLEAYVEEHIATTAGLAFSVFNNKEDLYLGYHGYSNIEKQIPVSEETVFEWGSVSKLLIWVSVFQLWEEDKIDLNEDIRTYLPEGFLKKAKENEKISMFNLMHHDAGWQEVVVDLFVEDFNDVEDLKETLKKTEPEQIYPVGKYKAYSNWGSTLAALIVQEITGQDFYEYVDENIFKPLDMKHTALLPDLRDNPWVKEKRKEVKGYTSENKLIEKDFYHITLYPSGMATGTLKDLEKFGKGLIAYEGQEVLFQKQETVNKLFEPTLYYQATDYPRNASGFWFEEYAVTVLGHGGNTSAFSSYLLIDPISKTCLVIMTNQALEKVYNTEAIPIIFGDFDPSPSQISGDGGDKLSGTYGSARTFLRGYGKLHSALARIRIKEIEEGQVEIIWPGDSFTGYEFEESLYNMEASLFQIYKDKDGDTILSMPYGDNYKIKKSQIVIDYTLLALALLAGLYSLIMLVFEILRSIRTKSKGQSPDKTLFRRHHLISLFAILLVFSNIGILAKKMIGFDIARNVLPHVYVSFILMLALLGYSIFSILALKRSNIEGKKKVKYIITSVASLIVALNIYYWQLYLIK